jgi:hypothetical protein
MKKMKTKMKYHRVLHKANVIHSSRSDTRVTDPMSFVETISEFSTTLRGATSSITRPSARLQLQRARNLNRRMCALKFVLLEVNLLTFSRLCCMIKIPRWF